MASLKVPEFDTTPRQTIKQHIRGSPYGYIDLQETAIGGIKNSFLRTIAPINPFARRQYSDEFNVGMPPPNPPRLRTPHRRSYP